MLLVMLRVSAAAAALASFGLASAAWSADQTFPWDQRPAAEPAAQVPAPKAKAPARPQAPARADTPARPPRAVEAKPKTPAVEPPAEKVSAVAVPTQAPDSCAKAYHQALAATGAEKAEHLDLMLRIVRTGDDALPGEWRHTSRLEAAAPRRATDKLERLDAASLPGEEASVQSLVADFVRARGSVPELTGKGRHAWAAQKVVADLKTYVSQPLSFAVCTGAVEYMDFLSSNLTQLRKRIDEVAGAAARGRKIVEARLTLLREAPRQVASTETPVITGSLPSPPAGGALLDKPELQVAQLVADAARELLAPEALATVLGEKRPLDAIGKLAAALDGEAGKALSDARLTAGKRVVAALEIALYAELMQLNYAEVEGAVFSTIGAVRGAHKAHCTCGG